MTKPEAGSPVTKSDYNRRKLSTDPFIERKMEFLIESMDDLSMEHICLFYFFYHSLSRQQA
ncbi:hypothetical protein HanRHA438_Chr07g0293731 [Helianthus annuus]|uniref:Uncharacterized protein n=1 Tax=Helianthus annuus TaxID=4232 RepID=A0A251UDA5_HELAN|nr:hypothetical protein HanXRQr2_Chr10g0441491 [Helianthus annuus]KAF5797661.1 hypothetical protein HanXRQr2_Chr07g0283271 [Helianthus annuus]KAJ0530007.1 hypothetical protein HanHA89_Chr10g0384661 [Helianthus annuus]KAJ0549363.1 hypothetical protein HanHA300_Chr07g0232731 [Helianthus annuus]KAJ0555704.1 hypothetical protein HanIR_Chr07g0305151 [Helianthus annuus]